MKHPQDLTITDGQQLMEINKVEQMEQEINEPEIPAYSAAPVKVREIQQQQQQQQQQHETPSSSTTLWLLPPAPLIVHE
ncbi:hypothetical protein AWZ03_007332 [Drosophila navojoa]|uniref:Uncharacterized protein n=1 Tax=Drosophila navojoa TaxID=7232 RepID=A0A484BBN0_DRONA|nr:hypothetical protein AWZ03_007332 [Drosophila navojoa]